MREFLSNEVQSFQPTLSEFDNLRLPSANSDLLKCLQPNSYGHTDSSTQFDCKVLDSAVIVNCLPTVEASTFHEYAEKVFIPHLQQPLHQSKPCGCCMGYIRSRQPKGCNKGEKKPSGQKESSRPNEASKELDNVSTRPWQQVWAAFLSNVEGCTIPMAQSQNIVHYIRLVTALKCNDFYLIIIPIPFNL